MGAATTPPIEFQNVKEIYRVIVLGSLFNSIHVANLLKFMLWSYGLERTGTYHVNMHINQTSNLFLMTQSHLVTEAE